MKEEFIRSFIHGVANTTGTLTVLGIVTSIWYIINSINSDTTVNFPNDQETNKESIENKRNEFSSEKNENKQNGLLDKSEREKRLESYNILLESLKTSFKESKSSNSFVSNQSVSESVNESVNESISECEEIEKIEQNELGQSFYAKVNGNENVDSKKYKKIFDKLLN